MTKMRCPECGCETGVRGKPFNYIGLRAHLAVMHVYSGKKLKRVMEAAMK